MKHRTVSNLMDSTQGSRGPLLYPTKLNLAEKCFKIGGEISASTKNSSCGHRHLYKEKKQSKPISDVTG